MLFLIEIDLNWTYYKHFFNKSTLFARNSWWYLRTHEYL